VLVVLYILAHFSGLQQCCIQLLANVLFTHASTNEHNLLAPAKRMKNLH